MLKNFARYPLVPVLHSPHLPPSLRSGRRGEDCSQPEQGRQTDAGSFLIDSHSDGTILVRSCASELKPL